MSKEGLTAKDFVGFSRPRTAYSSTPRERPARNFFADTLKQDAVIRNIEIIGEATNNLLAANPDIASRYPSIPFAQIYGMRNRVAHGYFAVSLSMVWDSVEVDVPELHREMARVLKELREGNE